MKAIAIGLACVCVGAAACSSHSNASPAVNAECSALSACCHSPNYPPQDLTVCEDLVSQNDATACAGVLSEYTPEGVCDEDAGPGAGGYACTYTGDAGAPACTYMSTSSATFAEFEADCSLTTGATLANALCPSAQLVGCCATSDDGAVTKNCAYAGSSGSLQSMCTASGGTWSTSP